MTMWLDFRTESMAPEVEINLQIHTDIGEGPERTLICADPNCGWWDVAFNPTDAVEMKNQHIQWHEEGMPE